MHCHRFRTASRSRLVGSMLMTSCHDANDVTCCVKRRGAQYRSRRIRLCTVHSHITSRPVAHIRRVALHLPKRPDQCQQSECENGTNRGRFALPSACSHLPRSKFTVARTHSSIFQTTIDLLASVATRLSIAYPGFLAIVAHSGTKTGSNAGFER